MKLTLKVILIIVLTVTSIISGIFYLLTLHFEEQMEKQLLNSARVVYNHITIVRQWVSDNEGVFVVKGPGKESNPFLKHPDLYTTHGDTLTLRNPALITRELSDLTYSIGKNFSFHLTSLNYINPSNKPDDFEKSALLNFNIKPFSDKNEEYYRTELNDNKRFFRYFAPLYTEESCLSCHADQGYKLGDVRGGISILLPMDQFQKAQKENLIFYLKSALFTICFLSILIFIALQRSVINPLKKIEDSVKKMREGIYDFRLQLYKKDEIGNLAVAFEEMRKKIKKYTGQLKLQKANTEVLSNIRWKRLPLLIQREIS